MRTISHPLDLLDHYAMNKKIKRFLIRETTNYLTNNYPPIAANTAIRHVSYVKC